MQKAKILFIGGGNMARAIIKGLLKQGYDPTYIYVVDHHSENREFFAKKHIQVGKEAEAFIANVDIVCLAIKPQGAQELCLKLHEKLAEVSPVILSIMAGITTASLNAWLGAHLPVVRAMPNTPVAVQMGATGLFATEQISDLQKAQVESILNAVGITAWLPAEADINAIIALSGSAPAYYFYFMEAMQVVAEKMGIAPDIAKAFAIQTAYGTAKLAFETEESLTTLREQVTSKKGTTEAALETFKAHDFSQIIEAAMRAAVKRAVELSQNT